MKATLIPSLDYNVTDNGFTLTTAGYTKFFIQPSFANINNTDGNYDIGSIWEGANKGFRVMTDVPKGSDGAPILDVWQQYNVLRPSTASCDNDTTGIFNMSTRNINVAPVRAAFDLCLPEFYQLSLEKFRDSPELLTNLVVNAIFKGIMTDIVTTTWVGGTKRSAPTNSSGTYTQSQNNVIFGVNSFDGIFHYIGIYINNLIPSSQVLTITQAGNTITPSEAFTAVKNAYDAQGYLMMAAANEQKAFYCNRIFYNMYMRYYQTLGQTTESLLQYTVNGINTIGFNGIPFYVQGIWDAVLNQIAGFPAKQQNVLILTMQENFIIGYDPKYGVGGNLKTQFEIFYSQDAALWKYRFQTALGTQIANPAYMVVCATDTTIFTAA